MDDLLNPAVRKPMYSCPGGGKDIIAEAIRQEKEEEEVIELSEDEEEPMLPEISPARGGAVCTIGDAVFAVP